MSNNKKNNSFGVYMPARHVDIHCYPLEFFLPAAIRTCNDWYENISHKDTIPRNKMKDLIIIKYLENINLKAFKVLLKYSFSISINVNVMLLNDFNQLLDWLAGICLHTPLLVYAPVLANSKNQR